MNPFSQLDLSSISRTYYHDETEVEEKCDLKVIFGSDIDSTQVEILYSDDGDDIAIRSNGNLCELLGALTDICPFVNSCTITGDRKDLIERYTPLIISLFGEESVKIGD